MVRRSIIVALIVGIAFISCKKDNNIGSPTVQITAPASNAVFKVFDTIVIKAHVSDAVSLQSVTVYMVNNQNIPVLPTATIPITSNNMSFTCPYEISDVHLSTGYYNIVVRAYNGTNATLAYQQIYINAAPKLRERIFALTRNSSGVHVLKIDTSSFNVSNLYTLSGDYSSSDISSYYQQLYIGAADSGNVNTLTMPAGSPAWNVTGLITPTPYFTNVYSYGDAVYVSEYLGFIKCYTHLGPVTNSITIAAGNYPIKTYVWGSYLFAEEKNIGSLTRNLVLYYTGSGKGFEQAGLSGPVVAMYGMDNNDVYIFGNQNAGGGYLTLFNVSGNTFYSPLTLPAGNILSVTQI
ncbi:MAG TPA: Ig-like domain-containing protein, partial [Bacteroidia bacterium]|nr:Ig-like domain-containing protein [Bacteroidia bacterium]